jgi:hypothetical protein
MMNASTGQRRRQREEASGSQSEPTSVWQPEEKREERSDEPADLLREEALSSRSELTSDYHPKKKGRSAATNRQAYNARKR